jgi:amidase
MDRRDFLRNGSLTGASLTMLAMASCQAPPDEKKQEAAAAREASVPTSFALNEVTIDGLQQKMKSGEMTARSIAEAYLRRIDTLDRKGPNLHSVLELNPDALAIADAMDQERKAGKLRGPMHGIPVLVKDNINTGDKMMTTAGALALEGNKAASDAFIIKKLRDSGAVILGKTNLSEWANFRSTRSTSGWSSRGGQTKCPYYLDRNPSGSSSGSGAAVASNLCAVAIGTETDGSVVSPASVNGLVGIKPTVGLLSRSGIIPISFTQDTAGPMARTVRDAAILLGALTGVDDEDPSSKNSAGHFQTDYTSYLVPDGLKGKRIGIEKSYLKGHEGVVGLYKQSIELLKSQGAEVIEVELMKHINELGPSELLVLQYEFKYGVDKYLSKANAKVKSLAAVIAFNTQNESRAMPFFKQETLEASDKKAGLDSKEYKEALAKSTGSRKLIIDLMEKNRLDALSAPTNGLACDIDLINGDYDTGFSFSTPAAVAGFPHITVPMGTVLGLPLGFSFMAKPYQEPELLKMAYHFEQATKKRTAPEFLDSSILKG